jgi:hypothetical protein
MKVMTVIEAEGQLPRLIAEVNEGEIIVLKDGDREVTLHPGGALDLEEDSSELEAELLKAANGPFTAYSSEEMRAIGERIIRETRDHESAN